ncbi:Nck-associated protein 5 [Galemys pyrenaicus]|uniref:Nck-associated protein 5 n=1 Tax=Galemys pyrenaicus TaxID=202257 RepID=A0A8J6A5R5_GALPY|nr:Nck-associated protein 5 [Galemys pyrenaicus]
MRTLDSGIGTFPLPDSGNRSAGRYLCQPDSPEDPEPILSLQPTPCTASSIRTQTLQREVPSSADSPGAADNTIVHSTSDPVMMARGMRPLQSRLPKPASSGKITSPKQNGAEPRPQTCSSFEYADNTMASKPLPGWEDEDTTAETQVRVRPAGALVLLVKSELLKHFRRFNFQSNSLLLQWIKKKP